MRGKRTDRPYRAVLAAQGGEPRGDLSAEELAFARQLMDAHRLATDAEPCPGRARHRAYALLDELPERPWEILARLVFDSWTELAPAARSVGSDRLLRYENASAAVDVQVGREPSSDDRLLAVAVEDCGEGCEAKLVLGGTRTLSLELDAHGTGSVRLADADADVVVVVLDEDGELLRTPSVPFR